MANKNKKSGTGNNFRMSAENLNGHFYGVTRRDGQIILFVKSFLLTKYNKIVMALDLWSKLYQAPLKCGIDINI